MPRSRIPVELLLSVIASYVVGIVQILAGIALIFVRYADGLTATDRTVVTIAGSITILIGLLVVALASGLTRSRRDARVLLTVLISISIALGVLVLIADGEVTAFRLIDLAISAAVIIVLWTGRVARSFARSDDGRTG
ncbi:hypothetical protein [Leifsonia poae]|uniref:Uncharacterized protein n=1 Tax=Leifsonia poae TaxID=110933 RepID=A0A9W6M0U4_9MICO|nr:hypothetical protein [Leifsonia poae]GLJ77087.1 hypothetical protein GCM10017584_26610 [Leifsonia poae]